MFLFDLRPSCAQKCVNVTTVVMPPSPPPPRVVITTNPLSDVADLPHARSNTLNSSTSSLDDSSSLRNRRLNRNFFRDVYNRLRIAAHLSHARRARPGNEAEPDVDAVLGDMQLDERITRTDSNRNRANYSRQASKQSQRKPEANTPLNHVEHAMQSTTRNYVLAKGQIHFWRNFQFEAEVGS